MYLYCITCHNVDTSRFAQLVVREFIFDVEPLTPYQVGIDGNYYDAYGGYHVEDLQQPHASAQVQHAGFVPESDSTHHESSSINIDSDGYDAYGGFHPNAVRKQEQQNQAMAPGQAAYAAYEASQRAPNKPKTWNRNARPCKFFLMGTCKFGDRCKFSHDLSGSNQTNNNSHGTRSNTQVPGSRRDWSGSISWSSGQGNSAHSNSGQFAGEASKYVGNGNVQMGYELNDEEDADYQAFLAEQGKPGDPEPAPEGLTEAEFDEMAAAFEDFLVDEDTYYPPNEVEDSSNLTSST